MNIRTIAAVVFVGAFFAQGIMADSSSDAIAQIKEDMVAVQGGTFLMGGDGRSENESPAHTVAVNSFYMLKTEVTQRMYSAVMGKNDSHFKGEFRPVEEASWYDAVVFCNKLSIQEGLKPAYSLENETDPSLWGDVPRINSRNEEKLRWNTLTCDFSANGYRLPTEAEWEYAARGGEGARSFLYSGSNNVLAVGWNSDDVDGETHTVAQKAANTLGLYDMTGNVWEWCWDWYDFYDSAQNANPAGPTDGASGKKIRRGGSISSAAVYCRVANRASSEPEIRGIDLGFRIVQTMDVPKAGYEIIDYPLIEK